jgi:plasmid stabilization system protein ParE
VTRYRVFVHTRAKREYAAALAWWRLNRRAAPNLLRDEVRAASRLLAEFPEAGELDATRGGEIRRLVLRGSRYLLFYRVDHDESRIEILSVWHSHRLPPGL